MSKPNNWYKTQPGYKKVGVWEWNDHRLWSKIEVSLDTDECWLWQGSMSPSGAIFGVRKDSHAQMSQARRLVFMSQTNEDVSPYRVTMKCKNQQCCNFSHFELKPNNRKNIFGEEL